MDSQKSGTEYTVPMHSVLLDELLAGPAIDVCAGPGADSVVRGRELRIVAALADDLDHGAAPISQEAIGRRARVLHEALCRHMVGKRQRAREHRLATADRIDSELLQSRAVLLLQLCRLPLLGLLSTEPSVLALASSVLIVALVHEPGRSLAIVITPALKAAGDVRFPAYIGVVSMWGVAVTGALLGIRLGWGLVGVWIAMEVDEWLRGLVMLSRWRSGVWRRNARVEAPAAGVAEASTAEIEQGI